MQSIKAKEQVLILDIVTNMYVNGNMYIPSSTPVRSDLGAEGRCVSPAGLKYPPEFRRTNAV